MPGDICGLVGIKGTFMRPIALATFAVLSVPTSAAAIELHLVCDGIGTITHSEQTNVSGFDAVAGHSISVQGPTIHTVKQVGDQVLVEVSDDHARIKLPQAFVPPLHSRDDDGWRQLDGLDVGETEIRGRYTLNFVFKPSVRISRTTGHIDIAGGFGSFSFSGDCERYDPTAAARKF